MGGKTLHDGIHRCFPEPHYPYERDRGTIFVCECGQGFHVVPGQFGYDSRWKRLSAEELNEFTGVRASSEPRELMPEIKAAPSGRWSLRQWWRRRFQLDKYPERTTRPKVSRPRRAR